MRRSTQAFRLWLGRLALAAAGALIALAALEGLARFLYYLQARRDQADGERVSKFFQADPDLEWTHIPLAQGNWPAPSGEFNPYVVFNSQGLHDHEYSSEKPVGTFRILLVGDSFAEAMQVSLEESTQQLLETALSQRATAAGLGPVEVINGGTSGYGPGHELLFYQKFGRHYRPDLIILFVYIGNDFEDESPVLAQRWFWPVSPRNKFYRIEAGHAVLYEAPEADPSRLDPITRDTRGAEATGSFSARADATLMSYSRLYGLLRPALLETPVVRLALVKAGLIDRPVPVSPKYAINVSSSAYDEAADVIGAIVGEFRSEAEADGAALVVVIIPERNQVQRELLAAKYDAFGDIEQYYDFEKPNRALAARFEAQAIAYLDLLPTFRRHVEATGEALYYAQEGHWNAAGNRLAAAEIETWLIANGYVPAAQ